MATKQTKKSTPSKTSQKPKTSKRLSTTTKQTATAQKTLHHVAFVIDRSSSMTDIAARVVAMLQARLDALRTRSAASSALVSLFTFHSRVDAPRFLSARASRRRTLAPLRCTGLTALDDAIGTAITTLLDQPQAQRAGVFFDVIVLTDGYENSSRIFKKTLPRLVKRVTRTGHWRFTVFTPKGGVKRLEELGIDAAHLGVWEPTAKGVADVGRAIDRVFVDVFGESA